MTSVEVSRLDVSGVVKRQLLNGVLKDVVVVHQTSQTSVHTSSTVITQLAVPGRGRSWSNGMEPLFAVAYCSTTAGS